MQVSQYLQRPEGPRSSQARITGSCELPDSSENLTSGPVPEQHELLTEHTLSGTIFPPNCVLSEKAELDKAKRKSQALRK